MSTNADVRTWTDEERWQVLMENVKDYGIFMLDPTGVVVTWNAGAERILGYKEHEILGRNFCDIFTPGDIDKAQPQFELDMARDRGRAEDERWHIRKDGSRFWASGVVTPLWDQSGGLRGFTKVLRDITERKHAEDRMQEENQRKDEFLAMLSHELRNPLAAIANAAQLLALDHSVADNPALSIIERQVSGLEQLIDDLTDVSRMRTGKIQLRVQRVHLQQVIQRAVETTRHLVESRKHTLLLEMPPEAVWLEADAQRLTQVFTNLLNNAAKYSEPGGQILLKLERNGNDACVRIKDTGVGILAEMLPRIFELFIQADRSLDRAQGGLGIGLTLVKRLVEMQGGSIEARSEGIGRGSEFVVRLPAVPEIIGSDPEKAADVHKHRHGLRLLLAEDNLDTAVSLGILLRDAGHEVEIVHDGAAALRTAEATTPHAVLMDIGLPKMDGYQVAERLRQQPKFNNTTLIAMTGYGQAEDRKRSEVAGFDLHLVKPVSFTRLVELLSQLSSTKQNSASPAKG